MDINLIVCREIPSDSEVQGVVNRELKCKKLENFVQ